MKLYYVYILSNKTRTVLYIGMTNDIVRRVWEHKNHCVEGFTSRYDIDKLVWFELHSTAENAIAAEKRIKRYKRDWKINLIEKDNPNWDDLFDEISGT